MEESNVKNCVIPLRFASLALAASLVCGPARAQTIDRVSVSTTGIEGNGASEAPAISADGRFVAFRSAASNLVAGDTNQVADVFVRDRQSGATERVSVSSGGVDGNLQCLWGVSISADGRFVAFSSYASNLVASDTNGTADIFVRDRINGTTEIVSVSSGGTQGHGLSDLPTISADGRFVAFRSVASDLVQFDANAVRDIFVRDRLNGTTERVSVSSMGFEGYDACDSGAISADGRFVAFQSASQDLVPNDHAWADIFVRDRQNHTTERVSVGPGGIPTNNDCVWPAISGNGRFVAFYSHATNLVPGANGWLQIFLHDRQTGTTEIASVSSAGVQGDNSSRAPSLSWDGRFVAFHSAASNLVAGDTNFLFDTFVHDRLLGTTVRVNVDSGGTQTSTGTSDAASISADGRIVAFPTNAPSLVAGDTNGVSDIFVHDDGTTPQVVFCSGDGSGTACPCGNSAASGSGCPSSINPNGARLVSSGIPFLASDSCLLTAFGMPDSSALYFQGTTQIAAGAGIVLGDGLRCAGGTIVRLKTVLNFGGASQYPGAGDPSISVKGAVTAPGTRTYQVWYRNAAAFCTSAPFNFTNGVEIAWLP